ncbi:DUF3310 domain-containing protein [Staphylococcus coagulans]|uniref:DUF3310 domain-containing protein n=1 Tax=Staphylococcus coagulans TaxID=74706 RepID=UPI001F4BE6CD|nr:DUF3310 domain-containing protein [Staphylococcus coagulans]UNB47645.1 DUF3310 domain-containing protein [Staphylococcus coagulans]
MKVKDLEIGDRVQIITGVHRYRANERWDEEPIGQTGEVRFKFADGSARVLLDKGLGVFISDDDEWYLIPSSTKIATHKEDVVNNPSHYTYGDIEVIDYIEQVIKDYPPHLAFAIGNAIMCINRAGHKNNKEDLAEARWYLERAYDKWEVAR